MYKIKHIPTGLFYQPSRGSGNLSIRGKLYNLKPSIPQVVRVVVSRTNKPNKRQKKILEVFNLSFDDSGWRGIDKNIPTSINDWEVIDVFEEKTDELHELTYEKVLEKLPDNITNLVGKDKIITKAFDLLKKSPYAGFAYLLGVVHSTRELYDGKKEIAQLLEQYGVFGWNKLNHK